MTDETRQEIARLLAKELAARTVVPQARPGKGFKRFSEFKRVMGKAGPGFAWHHIVGQTTSNLRTFGAEAIHNTGNLVRLEHGSGSIHQEITNFYNSIQPELTGWEKMTVREWIGKQSFAEQQDFGVRVVRAFGGII
ncbi:hypothetical protein [Okeania sp.]|uniref:hypothetical protein n=1 Tax=Okeania sp. TaxID=3100323 RepID=UPI002B4AC55A|nr:hypothetical protein [Okeania sp.]MEB3339341.1 hypothetical protein [Okeania sp.]